MPSHNTSLQILTLSYFVCLLLRAEDRLTRSIYPKKRRSAAVHAGGRFLTSLRGRWWGPLVLSPSTRFDWLKEGRRTGGWSVPSPTSRGSPFGCLHGTKREPRGLVLLLPHLRPLFVLSLSSLCPLGVSPVFSLVLQVVALRLATLRPVEAG